MSAGRGEFERLKKDSRKIKLREELQRLYHRIKKWGSISAATEKGGGAERRRRLYRNDISQSQTCLVLTDIGDMCSSVCVRVIHSTLSINTLTRMCFNPMMLPS